MRMNQEDASNFNTTWKSGKYSLTVKTLTADAQITHAGSIVNVFSTPTAKNVRLPFTEGGRHFAVANVGPADLTVQNALGGFLTTLKAGDASLYYSTDVTWVGVHSALNLGDFGYTGPGHAPGLVPDPGAGPAQAPPNLRFLSELGWSTVTGLATSNDYFKGHKGGAVTLTPLGSETLEFLSANTGITILANAGTTPKSIGFTLNVSQINHDATFNYVADQHVAHSAVTLTAGLGISGGGTIAASRTFDFAPSELTVNGAPVAGDYLVMDLAAGGPRRTLVSTLGSIINHNALLNYVAFEHINHANVSMVAGMGLSGGGDLTTSRSFAVNFDEFPTDSPSGNDFIPFLDSSDGLHKKTLVSNVGGGGSGGGSGGSQVWMTDTQPLTALNGDLWWETDTGYLFVYYDDGSSAQWVSALPSAAGGSMTEAPTDTKVYGRKDGAWARAVSAAGDTMTGGLNISSTLNVTGAVTLAGAITSSANIYTTGSVTVASTISSGEIYFGITDGNRRLTYNGTMYQFTTAPLNISSNAASTSNATGALTVNGGVGILGALNAGTSGADGAMTFYTGTSAFRIGRNSAQFTDFTHDGADVRWMATTAAKLLAIGTTDAGAPITFRTNGAERTRITDTNFNIPMTTVSAGSLGGALTVAGGVGISGALNVAALAAIGLGGAAAAIGQLTLDGGSAVGGGGNIAFRRNSVNSWNVGHITVTSGGSTSDFSFYNWGLSVHALRIAATTNAISLGSTSASTLPSNGALVVAGGVGVAGSVNVGADVNAVGSVLISGPSGYLGFAAGSGGAVTQITSQTTTVATNRLTFAVTLFTAIGSTAYQSFNVANGNVDPGDVIIPSQKSGANMYEILITSVQTDLFRVTFRSTGGVVSDTPVFNFVVIKGQVA